MLTTRDILFGVALPGVISLLVLMVAWQPWRRQSPLAGRYWGGSAALGGGFAAAYLGWLPRFPPVDSTDWLFSLTFLLIAIGVTDGLRELPAWVRGGGGLVGSIAVVCLLLYPRLLQHKWGILEGTAWIAALSAAVLVSWAALGRLARDVPGLSVPVLFLIVAAAASMVLMLSGFKKFAHLGGALTATLGASLPVAWWSSNFSLSRGGVLVFVVLLAGLLIGGHFYAELTALNAVLLFAAPLLSWVGQAPVAKNLTSLQRLLLSLALPVALCSTALLLAVIDFLKSMSERSSDYPY